MDVIFLILVFYHLFWNIRGLRLEEKAGQAMSAQRNTQIHHFGTKFLAPHENFIC